MHIALPLRRFTPSSEHAIRSGASKVGKQVTEEKPDPAEDLVGNEGHPAIATTISSLLLLMSSCNRPDQAYSAGPEAAGYLAGSILASVAIFWGIPYLITIRKSSRRWKIGSFVAIALLSVLANLWAIGSRAQQIAADASNPTRQMREIAEGKRSALEADPDAGPLQKVIVELGNRNIADLQSFQSALAAAGAERISMMQDVRPNSPELGNCGTFTELAGRARNDRGKLKLYLDDARRKLEAEVAAGALSSDTVDGFLKGAADAKPRSDRTWDLQERYAEAVGQLCQILARKNWRVERGQAAFTSMSDLAAANVQLAVIEKIGIEQERARREAMATLKAPN